MLQVPEEMLVLSRAVERGDIQESDVPPENVSAPQEGTLRYGRRLDRLLNRGRLTEPQVLQILNEVRRDSQAIAQTLDAGQISGTGQQQDPPPPTATDPAAAVKEEPVTARERGLAQTVDGPQLEYLGPRSTSPFPCENWARYEFLALLGQGGMGAVYKARDRRLGRIVALKFIRGNDDQMTQRFMQEARAQSRLEHESICRVLEVGEVEGKAYIAMLFIEGQSLDKAGPGLSLNEKVQILRDVALAMHYAHEKGVIHRDIKPAKVTLETRP